MCREILTGKGVLVRRPDAEELLSIRAGAWNYFELVAWATEQDAELTKLMRESPLPNQPDKERAEAVCMALIEKSFDPSWTITL